jgi:hypothetical protein
MKSITVTELYTGKEYIFDNISRFTTVKTLKKVIQAKTHLDSKFQQLFYAHEFVRDDQLVHDLVRFSYLLYLTINFIYLIIKFIHLII